MNKNAIVTTQDSLILLISNQKSLGGLHRLKKDTPRKLKLRQMLKLKPLECRFLSILLPWKLNQLPLKLKFKLLSQLTPKLKKRPKQEPLNKLLKTRLKLMPPQLRQLQEIRSFLLRDNKEKLHIKLPQLLLRLLLIMLQKLLLLLKEESSKKLPRRQRKRLLRLKLLLLLLLNKRNMRKSQLHRRQKLRLIEGLKQLLKLKWRDLKRLKIERLRLSWRLKMLKCWLLRNRLILKSWLPKLSK